MGEGRGQILHSRMVYRSQWLFFCIGIYLIDFGLQFLHNLGTDATASSSSIFVQIWWEIVPNGITWFSVRIFN